jgi:hypothetical protein
MIRLYNTALIIQNNMLYYAALQGPAAVALVFSAFPQRPLRLRVILFLFL